jgi:hypothetical protein
METHNNDYLNSGLEQTSNNVEERTVKTYKVPSYIRNAVKRYQEKNKEKINEYFRSHSKEKYDNDPLYREQKKQKSRERYMRNKLKNNE